MCVCVCVCVCTSLSISVYTCQRVYMRGIIIYLRYTSNNIEYNEM